MKTEVLNDAKDFFEQVVQPCCDEFLSTPSTFKTAFNVATALFHMHEWLYEYNRPALEATYGVTFAKKGDLWVHIEGVVSEAKFVRDLANASKHVRLTLRPSTTMTHIANTVIQTVGFGEGGYGVGRYSAPSVMMKDGSNDVSLDDCVNKLLAFWQLLVTQLYP